MSELKNLYPPSPGNVDLSITEPSSAYQKQVQSVARSIVTFILVYILLIIAAIGLVIACGYLSLIIANYVRVGLIIWLVGGIMIFAGLTLFFLLKFIFSVKRQDLNGLIEVTPEHEPVLYQFIDQLAADVKTNKPKRIFIASNVNASVFYNSSFWSMFFPVRKNLTIGLGLMQTLSVSELKAVLAHEFGHFSQRSMKLDSYVYQTNRVLYNLLYENESWENVALKITSWNSILSMFATLSFWLVSRIMQILQYFYVQINKKQRGLSREMEFHADAVAASVAGSNHLIQSLRKADFASFVYSTTLTHCEQLIQENSRPQNVYTGYQKLLQFIGEKNHLQFKEGLPYLTDDAFPAMSKSRINFKDQWASHPSTQEREEHLIRIGITTPDDDRPAMKLLKNEVFWQETLTTHLYETVTFQEEVTLLDENDFIKRYEQEYEEYKLPEVFNGYYNDRIINEFDLNETLSVADDWKEIFTDETATLNDKIRTNTDDLHTLKAIEEGAIDTISFDFDGKKYKREGAATWANKLSEEIDQQIEKRNRKDQEIYQYFYRQYPEHSEQLKAMYRSIFENSRQLEEFIPASKSFVSAIEPFFSNTEEPLNGFYQELIYDKEPPFKKALLTLANEIEMTEPFAGKVKERIEAYAQESLSKNLDTDQLLKIYHIQNDFILYLNRREFVFQKQALEIQDSCLKREMVLQ